VKVNPTRENSEAYAHSYIIGGTHPERDPAGRGAKGELRARRHPEAVGQHPLTMGYH
jgi:hypothetical protein